MDYLRAYKERYQRTLDGASYIDRIKDGTVLYLGHKLAHKISGLAGAEKCLLFVETGMEVPEEFRARHMIIECVDPAAEYALVAEKIWNERQKALRRLKYTVKENGIIIGENVKIGENTILEPGCFIDHNVSIGSNCVIMSGVKIRSASIGDNCIIMQNAVIGSQAYIFGMVNGRKKRIFELGGVIIGNDVELGVNSIVSCGTGSDSHIGDNTKIGNSVLIGHDFQCGSDVSIYAGNIIAGYVNIGAGTTLAMGCVIKNRIEIGEKAFVGIGSVIDKNVQGNSSVLGYPARVLDIRH